MKTITFENVDPLTEDDNRFTYIRDRINRGKSSNGLFHVLYNGYSFHIPITLRPDDILNNVASVWSKYVIVNAEKFRDFFVQHEGQKFLEYISGGTYSENRLPEFMNGLSDLIIKDQKDDKITWACGASFSTTNESDQMVRSSAILASQKEYYEYGVTLCCGFPQINLEGTEEDWADLCSCVSKMPCPDGSLYNWKNQIIDVVENMIEGSEDFWQSCVVDHPYGSGGQSRKDGWITTFNPINENGDWVEIIEDNGVLDLMNEFDIKVNDNGNEFDLTIRSGPTYAYFNNDLKVMNMFKSKILEKSNA